MFLRFQHPLVENSIKLDQCQRKTRCLSFLCNLSAQSAHTFYLYFVSIIFSNSIIVKKTVACKDLEIGNLCQFLYQREYKVAICSQFRHFTGVRLTYLIKGGLIGFMKVAYYYIGMYQFPLILVQNSRYTNNLCELLRKAGCMQAGKPGKMVLRLPKVWKVR